MIKTEFDEVAKLIVSIRRDVETLTAKCAALEAERDELAAHVSAHVDALKQSNAQCGEYLRQNEQLHSELVEVRADLATVSAERDSLKRTLKEWEEAETKPHVRVAADDIADHVVPPAVPRCEVCHGCGSALVACSNSGLDCQNRSCNRTCTTDSRGGMSPWAGVCKQQHAVYTVRHE